MDQSRLLAPCEKWYFWRNELGMYSNFRIGCQYSIDLTPDIIFNVINKMVYKYPSLTMNIYDNGLDIIHEIDNDNNSNHQDLVYHDDNSLKLKFMPSFKLNDILEIINDENLSIITLFDSLQFRRFRYGGKDPLWKLILLNKRTLIYFSDHVLFDGTSGSNFHKVFSDELFNLRGKETNEFQDFNSNIFDIKLINRKKYKLSPNPTKLLNYSVPIYYLLYIVMIFYLPKLISNKIQYFIDDGEFSYKKSYNILSSPSKDSIQKDTCKHLNIGYEKMKKLLDQCKKNKVKLTSLLVIMALISIKSITGPNNDTMTIVPVNSRFQINEDINDEFGLYLGDVHIEMPALDKLDNSHNSGGGGGGGSNNFINWELVKYVNKVIQRNKNDSLKDLGLVSWINPKDFLKQRRDETCNNQMCATLVVSNLGYIKDPNGNIEEVWFDQPCQSATLGLFSLSVIGSNKGINLILRSMKSQWLNTFTYEMDKLINNV